LPDGMAYAVRLALSKMVSNNKEESVCPCCSVKFGRKVQYVNYLHELEPHMPVARLPVPNQVKE